MTVIKQPHEEAFDKLVAADIASATLSIVLSSRKDATVPNEYQRLQITKSLSDFFKAKVLKGFLTRKSQEKYNGDIELHEYDRNAGSHTHEIQYLALENFPEISQQLAPLSSVSDLPVYAENTAYMKRVRFYIAHAALADGTEIKFLRRYSHSKALMKSTMFSIFMADGQYDILEEKTLNFDYGIDSIIFENYVFILDDQCFLSMFNLYESLRANAKTIIDQVSAHVPILGLDKFTASCLSDTRKCAKLKSISDRNYLSGISFDKIKQTIASHNVPVEIKVDEDGRECLVFDPSKKWAILKLLHDDYVESKMTGNKYEALNKRVA